ncbi:hypothetical protein [Flavihumibacter petaseus]|uniref:DUF5683 domain-containing protein n=1 Tax=Flavihumibacter petaseus NBRC 106054 TaxID=1220578 RepID=A0A0E9MYR4_9BACT|nr:hypothetical protein [Flavihumibacter petaseus]GAO42250.1 hypothetical protein FPE01S_01_12630 [Flavihumibacter petaseus NBRC 106054]
MRKSISLVIFLALCMTAFAQTNTMSDYIALKKKNGRHVGVYFPGSPIGFLHVSGQRIDGYVDAVRNDSVFIRQWNIQSYITTLGTSKVDTVGYYIHKLHYTEIRSIYPDKKESWKFVKNGSIFMIGGAGYALLNVINGAYLDEPLSDPDNMKSLGIALGVAAGGFVLNRIYHKKEKEGKKYVITYVKMTTPQ